MSDNLLKTHGYLYLIREREFLQRDENVYKIGMTVQGPKLRIKRLDAYKKGSELRMVVYCPVERVFETEKVLKNNFRQIFEAHPDGFEYFVGDPVKMTRLIFEEVLEPRNIDLTRRIAEKVESPKLISLNIYQQFVKLFVNDHRKSNDKACVYFTIKQACEKWNSYKSVMLERDEIKIPQVKEADLKAELEACLQTKCLIRKWIEPEKKQMRSIFLGFRLIDKPRK